MTDGETIAHKAIELNPYSAIDYYNISLLLAQDPGRVSQAEAAHRKATELETTHGRLHFLPCLHRQR
jgi:hypothetical protein